MPDAAVSRSWLRLQVGELPVSVWLQVPGRNIFPHAFEPEAGAHPLHVLQAQDLVALILFAEVGACVLASSRRAMLSKDGGCARLVLGSRRVGWRRTRPSHWPAFNLRHVTV